MRTFRFLSLLLVAACALGTPVAGAVAVQSQASPVPAAVPARPGTTRVAAAPSTPAKKAVPAGSDWSELTAAQQSVLAPLAGAWVSLSQAQKRKWLALSRNYPKMQPDEQATLRSRMTEWVALSPQQRTQARLNFGETSALSPDNKKAKWEAYQALSAEERRKLASGATDKPPSTAAAVRPVPAQKLATVPTPRRDARTPRIAAGPAAEAAGSHHSPAASAPGTQTN